MYRRLFAALISLLLNVVDHVALGTRPEKRKRDQAVHAGETLFTRVSKSDRLVSQAVVGDEKLGESAAW